MNNCIKHSEKWNKIDKEKIIPNLIKYYDKSYIESLINNNTELCRLYEQLKEEFNIEKIENVGTEKISEFNIEEMDIFNNLSEHQILLYITNF